MKTFPCKTSRFEFPRRCCVLLSLVLCLVAAPRVSLSQDFAGWSFVANRLIQDGVSEDLVRTVYNGETIPPFDFVPFKLAPKETPSMYRDYNSAQSREQLLQCYERYRKNLAKAKTVFSVEPALVAAILFIETRCGKNVGRELVVNRLSRVASCLDPNNVRRNHAEILKDDSSVKLEQVKHRAQYLFEVFYPQLHALFDEHEKGNLDLFELRGSIAGAFGLSQFLPLTFAKYAVDGDANGHISLFSPDDAILSVAHFFAANGWKPGISTGEKRKIIWKYNRSEPYIDTVLALQKHIEKRS